MVWTLDLEGEVDNWIAWWWVQNSSAVAMSVYRPGGGYVDQRVGGFVAAGSAVVGAIDARRKNTLRGADFVVSQNIIICLLKTTSMFSMF